MNERIKQLWDDAALASGDESKTWDGQVAFMALFAELIVKECVGRIKLQHQMDEVTDDWVYNTIQTDLKEHFGVEE